MLTTKDGAEYREAFGQWLRTGLWPLSPEVKRGHQNGGGNPNHNLNNGQFTFGPGGAAGPDFRYRQTDTGIRPAQTRPALPSANPAPPRPTAAPASGSKPAQTRPVLPPASPTAKPVQLRPATAPTTPVAKPKKASSKNIANGTNDSDGQINAEQITYGVINTRLALPGVTADARDQLEKFVNGTPNPKGGKVYEIGSAGSNEVRDSDYVKELDAHVQANIAKRNGGKIPDGYYEELNKDDKTNSDPRRFEAFRSAGVKEAIQPFGLHVTLADVIGSFTYRLKVHVSGSKVTYTGINDTTLGSFHFGNLKKTNGIDSKLVDPIPGSGPLGTISQTAKFEFIKRY